MADKSPDAPWLSPTQTKVVRLCSLGCTVKEIARILDLSPHTVDHHKAEAMRRADAPNVALLTRFALRFGISNPQDVLTEREQARLRGR
jgi:DNA-binding CsgD family transcriptional regulator